MNRKMPILWGFSNFRLFGHRPPRRMKLLPLIHTKKRDTVLEEHYAGVREKPIPLGRRMQGLETPSDAVSL